jgi:hypothetical protein
MRIEIPEHAQFKAALALCILLLSACGGGGGGGNSSGGGGGTSSSGGGTATAYSIGGTISGLTESGLVLASGGTTLSIDANETSFGFQIQVNSGTAYTVTIQAQPTGETCSIANGSGTVQTADVENIGISCFKGTGVGWLPYLSDNGSGQYALYIVDGRSIPNSQATAVAGAPVVSLGASQYWVNSGSGIGNHWDYELLFAALATDGHVHLFQINLTNSSATSPTPTQVGSLSLSSTSQICNWSTAQTSLSDPTTAFAILHLAAADTACNSDTDTWQLVHFTDATSVAPTPLPIKQSSIVPLYDSNGLLASIVQYDYSTQNVYSYADDSFTNPTALVSGVQAMTPLVDYNRGSTGYLGDTWYLGVTSGSSGEVLRVPAKGAASVVYKGNAGPAIADGNNVYFVGSAALMEISATQASPNPISLCSIPGTISAGLQLVGSNGQNVVFTGTNDASTWFLDYCLVNGGPGQTPTPIWGNGTTAGQYTDVGLFYPFMALPSVGDYASATLFVSFVNNKGQGQWSAQMQGESQSLSVTPQTASNSAFIPTSSLPVSVGNVLQVLNIPGTNTGGNISGGSLSNITPGAASPLTTTGASPYTVPTGAYYGPPDATGYVSPLWPTGGTTVSGPGSTFTAGLFSGTNGPVAISWSNNVIQSVSVAGSMNVIPALDVYYLNPYYPDHDEDQDSTSTVSSPTTPINVIATAQSATSVQISWTASTDIGGPGIGGYYVHRNGGATPIATVAANTTSYVDTSVTPSTTYTYTVAAFDLSTPTPSVSAQSASASVTTPAATPPAGLTCTQARLGGTNGVSFGPGNSSGPGTLDTQSVTYQLSGTIAYLTWGASFDNLNLTSSAVTGSLEAEVWAVNYNYQGGAIVNQYLLATFVPNFTGQGAASSNQIDNGYWFYNIQSTTTLTPPPSGTYCIVVTLEQYAAGYGYQLMDWVTFNSTVSF